MAEEITEGTAEQATEIQEVVETPPPPTEKTYTKAELDAEVLKVRQEHSKREQRTKELEAKAQLSDQMVRELSEIRQRQDSSEVMLATFLDTQSGDDSHTRSLQERRKVVTPVSNPVADFVLKRISTMAQEAGLELSDPTLCHAQYAFEAGRFEEAEREAKQVVDKVKEKKTVAKQETPEDMEKRITAKVYAKLGYNPDSVDTSTPVGGRVFTRKQIVDMPDEDYKKNKAAIDAAAAAGHIK